MAEPGEGCSRTPTVRIRVRSRGAFHDHLRLRHRRTKRLPLRACCELLIRPYPSASHRKLIIFLGGVYEREKRSFQFVLDQLVCGSRQIASCSPKGEKELPFGR